MAVPTMTVIDAEGTKTEHPVHRSALLKFERRMRRPFNQVGALDAMILAFFIVNGRWAASETELDGWVDDHDVDVVTVDETPGGEPAPDPTVPATAPTF